MSILVENDEQPVDLNQGVLSDKSPEPEPTEPPQEEVQAEAPAVPDKFKGKELNDVISMYQNLESEYGRMSNQVGEYRSMTDRFLALEEKRLDDLQSAGAKPEEVTVDPTNFLSSPNQELDKWLESKLPQYQNTSQVEELERKINQLEGQLGQATLNQQYPDANEVFASPEFAQWVQGSPQRTRFAQNAVQSGDLEMAAYLLTEFKDRQSVSAPAPAQQQNEIQAAQAVSTETSSTGNATGDSKPRFSRKKLVDLKMFNPEEYERMNDQIVLAYAEGRVDD